MMSHKNLRTTSIVKTLHDRELGLRTSYAANDNMMFIPDIERRLDNTFNDISKCVRALSCAIDGVKWTDIQHAIRILFSKMLEMSLPDQASTVNLRRKQEREVFVALGGMHLLLRLFEKPFCEHDARSMSASFVNTNSELWNEVLVILREVCYTIPTLSEQLFGNNHIIFFFSLLVHRSVFENSISILEEILAVRIETFSLALVPNFYSLISKFSARHLAHFCRVLSLVLFEPEDRQILEGCQVLRSLELLQLRRDRVAKSSNIVERNQCLIIDMPDLLNRFLTLLRVANYGPNLADLARHNINAQDSPGNADLFQFISTSRNNTEMSEWDHLLSLDTIVKSAEASGELSNPNRSSNTDGAVSITSGRNTGNADSRNSLRSNGSRANDSRYMAPDISLDETMAELLAAFAPGAETDGQRPMDLSALMNVVQIAQSLGLTAISPDGAPISLPDNESYTSMGFGSFNSWGAGGGGYRRGTPCPSTPPQPPSATAAKKELQFHAMFLNPHHVELLFVLCTLLSGRRKINVQQKLASLGIADILLDMYGRMSWESKPFHGHNPMEHIHGPGCDCNPESALRVQYLRLVHNSYDRDFLGNNNKMLLLSSAEKDLLRRCKSPNEVSKEGFFIGSSDRGIFTRIVHTLLKEPVESVYRFWLSSCLESFLRGSGPDEQVFIAISGILSYTVTHIVDMGIRPSASANLQTAFDLLGELVKGNHHTIEMVDSALGETNFVRFMDAVMSNLVDSNVFVRSLYLSIDAFSDSETEQYQQPSTRRERDSPSAVGGSGAGAGTGGYLSHSWVQYAPQPLCQRAIDMVKAINNTEVRSSSGTKPQTHGLPLPAVSSSRRRDRSRGNVEERGSATQSAPSSSSSSRISHSVRGALQNIREVASHFLTFSGPAATHPCTDTPPEWTGNVQSEFVRSNSQQSLQVSLLKERRDLEGDTEIDYEEFFTPPEAPHYPRGRVESGLGAGAGTGTEISRPLTLQRSVESKVATSSQRSSDGLSLPFTSFKSVGSGVVQVQSEKIPLLEQADHVELKGEAESEDNSADQDRHRPEEHVPLPQSLQRFHCFLVQQREYILFRLMITVTMYTINHENICCLNTALLILLLADKRGQLAKLLQDVRLLAESHTTQSDPFPAPFPSTKRPSDSEPSSGFGTSRSSSPSPVTSPLRQSSDPNATWKIAPEEIGEGSDMQDMYCRVCDAPAGGSNSSLSSASVRGEKSASRSSSVSPLASVSVSVADAEFHLNNNSDSSSSDSVRSKSRGRVHCVACSAGATPTVKAGSEEEFQSSHTSKADTPVPSCSRSDRVMVNFRELLWYWREYYLRRGRDRLSIEFSSHIPFFQWNSLVDTLCRDNGSPTALLSGPIPLPKSPYHRAPRAHNGTSPDFVQYVP